MQLPISRSLTLWSCLAPFLRYVDLLDKNCRLFLPLLSHSAPSLPMFLLQSCGEVNHQDTRAMRLYYREEPVIVAGVTMTQCKWVSDRQTDGRIYYS